MFWIAHGVHLALLVGGAVGVVLLLGPEAERRLRVRQLRAAASGDRLVELATERAWVEQSAGREVPGKLCVLLGLIFGVGCTATAVLAGQVTRAAWPPLWLLAGTLVVTSAIGVLAYHRRRSARGIAFVAIFVELMVHAALVLLPVLSALRRSSSLTNSFAAALFCHSVGSGPSSATVRAAAAHLGVSIPPPPTTSGFLSPSSTALAAGLLVVTGLFALYLRSNALPTRPVANPL